MQLSIAQQTIHWEAAHFAVRAAVGKAVELGVQVSVAIVDTRGIQVAALHMPGASLHSIDVALDKAYTAASFGFPTRDWHDVLGTFSPQVQAGIIQRPRLVVFGGGIPFLLDGERIGAIGVSGASEAQDELCAAAAVDALVSVP